MIAPPNGAPAFPADYLAHIATLGGNQVLPLTVLYAEPRDPAVALGRQGDENFWYSTLIGERKDGLLVVLKYDSRTAYSQKVWQYCIVGGAEWDVAMEFPSFGALLEYLEAEKPLAPRATTAPRKNRQARGRS